MVTTNSDKYLLTYALPLVGLVSLFAFARSSVTLARNLAAHIDQVGTIETEDLGLLHPAGLAFSPEANAFFVLPVPSADQPTPATTNLALLSPYEEWLGMVNLTLSITDPINMAFDSRANRLVLFEAVTNNLVEIKAGPGGSLDPTTLTRIEAEQFGLQHPQGMAFDPGSGHLFILDGAAARIVRIDPDPTPGLDSVVALKQGRISQLDLKPLGLADARGLAFNPANSHLYVLNSAAHRLDELTDIGQLVASYDLTEFDLMESQGLVFAPSRDNTDDPLIINLYLADSGLRAEPTQRSAPGKIIEFSFMQPVASAFRASTVNATLVRTTRTSQFSPPSPDPSGLAYIPSSNTLLISDGEVDEMPPYFRGKNLFEVTLKGRLTRTYTTLSFSNEPTGLAYNPLNYHLFISDDTKSGGKRIFELDPGPDGRYNTSDDLVTSFVTTAFGNFDPEGVAFDNWLGHLYIIDGSGEEVYQVRPGVNGRFDGVPPAGDDQVTHFDVTSMGLQDPEGIEFNPDNGHLYVLSGKARAIAETTTNGVLIRKISISFLTSKALAGLAYAPDSRNPNKKNLYIVDRAIDNGTDPNENDGKMYEISFPALPTAPSNVVINGPAVGVINNSYSFTATVSPATATQPLTYLWRVMGQASQTHTDGLSDSATFTWNTSGTKAITVTASNDIGTPVEATSTIFVMASAGEQRRVYLPLLLKDR